MGNGGDEVLDDFVALALKVSREVRHLTSGCDGKKSTGLKCLESGGEPFFIVHQQPTFSAKRSGIKVNHDRMKATGLLVKGRSAGIAFQDNAWIVQRGFREKLTIPLRSRHDGFPRRYRRHVSAGSSFIIDESMWPRPSPINQIRGCRAGRKGAAASFASSSSAARVSGPQICRPCTRR